ncbi:MAG: PilZ domain-containing protein [Xanthomonadales bacterium]|nr:PilZ domain-containing protein [Xanthomonadales bacterium]
MTEDHATEQRRSDRKTLSSIVPVFDAMTGERIGHIGNVSAGGVMVICQIEVGEGNLYQLNFVLPEAEDPAQEFNVGAHCLWCSEAQSTGTFWAGFEIIDATEEEAEALEDIVLQL